MPITPWKHSSFFFFFAATHTHNTTLSASLRPWCFSDWACDSSRAVHFISPLSVFLITLEKIEVEQARREWTGNPGGSVRRTPRLCTRAKHFPLTEHLQKGRKTSVGILSQKMTKRKHTRGKQVKGAAGNWLQVIGGQRCGWRQYARTHTYMCTLWYCYLALSFPWEVCFFYFICLLVNEMEMEQQWLLGNGGAGGVFERQNLRLLLMLLLWLRWDGGFGRRRLSSRQPEEQPSPRSSRSHTCACAHARAHVLENVMRPKQKITENTGDDLKAAANWNHPLSFMQPSREFSLAHNHRKALSFQCQVFCLWAHWQTSNLAKSGTKQIFFFLP